MKKIISLSLVTLLVLSAFILTACGSSGGSDSKTDLSDSKYVGTWKVTSVSMGEESEDLDDEWILTINADGTGTLTSGDEDPANFTWTPTDDGFKTQGDVKTPFKDDGDNIKTSILGAELVFEKQ